MKEKILIFGHKNPDTDSICSSIVKQILNEKTNKDNSIAVRLGKINKETKYILDYLQLEEPMLVEEIDEGQRVILVDHNEFNQSVKGIDKAKIIGVIDHHKIANFETSEPIYFTSKPYGCTSTILYYEFINKNIKIDKKEAVLMLSAIISDTLLLKSPTTTKKDIEALKELEKIAEVNVSKYGIEMLKAGTDLDDFSDEELINIDSKDLEKGDLKYVISQVNTVSIENVLLRINGIKEAIEKEITNKNLNIYMLLITDILNNNSEAVVLGDKVEIIEKSFDKKLIDDRMFLEGVVSRKKQIIPPISENI